MGLRVHIDGTWTSVEFSEFFGSVTDIALRLQTFMPVMVEDDIVVDSDDALVIATFEGAAIPLIVRRVSFSSPGFTDFVGVAGIAKEVRLFLQFVIKTVVERNDRGLDRENRRLELDERRLRLEVLNQYVKKRAFSLSPEEQFNYRVYAGWNDETSALFDLIDRGLVTSVEETEDSDLVQSTEDVNG